jgi:DhnA family fructose-bisphosphate aldolase class Ia
MSSDPPQFRKRRLHRIFADDGRTLIVAMDHLSRLGRGVRIREPGRILREAGAAGTDAVLLRPGIVARHGADIGRMGTILSVGADSAVGEWGVDLALRLGVDAVKVEVFPGSEQAPDPRLVLGPLAQRCEAWSLPLLAETIPVSFDAKEAHTPEHLTDAARLAADLGVDIVKTGFTGDADSFAELVALAGLPVVVLGGSQGNLEALFTSVRQALDAGGAGAAVGRRIWNGDHPGRIAGALSRLIHEDISVGQAVAEATRTVVGPA